jgi:hypothetical protein
MNHSTLRPASSDGEFAASSSWASDSEASYENSYESDYNWLADEEYWEDERAADAWLSRFPGGTRLLYPQLYVVKPRGGKVVTPPRNSNTTHHLLRLPSEIRNRIYSYCFDFDNSEENLPEKGYAPFQDRYGMEMQRISISSDNVELKFWLSTTLLQVSRQVRFEAMVIFFSNRVITVEWLPALPRLVKFLGKKGCAMLWYLDIWDTLDLKQEHKGEYCDIIASISHFPRLQHLRIVLCGDTPTTSRDDRINAWFDTREQTHSEALVEHAVPKMRYEDIERHWPEYEILKSLKAKEFTLAVEFIENIGFLEFDRNYGAYPEISKSMQSNRTPTKSATAAVATPSISHRVLETFGAIENQPCSRAFTSSKKIDEEDSDSPTWQDTDSLSTKTIPLYNFFREFFYSNIILGHPRKDATVRNFIAFPTAQESTGSIMRDCPLCYLSERHCGYHAVPDRTTLEPDYRDDDGREENTETLRKRFEEMSYVEMKETCRDAVHCVNKPESFVKALAVLDYVGWFETPNSERLSRLDAAVSAGWMGKRVDKNEVPPWDLLFREIRSVHGRK